MLINLISEEQGKIAVSLKRIQTTEVLCFELRNRAPVKGVISGLMTDVQVEYLKNITGVVGAWRLTRWVNGEKEESLSLLLFFDKEQISTHVKLGYVKYAVRAFVPKPLQCKNCKGFGHVSSVCRRTEYTEERCVEGRQCRLFLLLLKTSEDMMVNTPQPVVNVCCQTKDTLC